jgi:hypothetical protein
MIYMDVKQFIGAYDISGDMNAINITSEHVGVDTSTFGHFATRNSRGQEQVGISGTGIHLQKANAAATLVSHLSLLEEPYTCLPFGESVGNTALLIPTLTTFDYSLGLTVNDKAPFSVSGKSDGTPLVQKGFLLAIGEKTSNGNSAVIQVGAVPSGKSLYVNFHCLDLEGTDVLLTLDRDSVATFDATPEEVANVTFTEAGAESGVSAAASALGYYRLSWEIDGNAASIVVAVGIK